jgi:hypothetical protein
VLHVRAGEILIYNNFMLVVSDKWICIYVRAREPVAFVLREISFIMNYAARSAVYECLILRARYAASARNLLKALCGASTSLEMWRFIFY